MKLMIRWSAKARARDHSGADNEPAADNEPCALHNLVRYIYYGLKGNKCLACGKPAPYYNINHAIKYNNNNFITVLISCYARRNY
jgi:hypothetical protein